MNADSTPVTPCNTILIHLVYIASLVTERDRQTDRHTETERDRERVRCGEIMYVAMYVCIIALRCVRSSAINVQIADYMTVRNVLNPQILRCDDCR